MNLWLGPISQSTIRVSFTLSLRWFSGRQILAQMYDGLSNYAVKVAAESWEEQEARLEAYARELEEKEQKEAAGAKSDKELGA